MTKSPCKNCSRKDLPKEDCAADCRLLGAIQNVEIETKTSCVHSRQDYTETCVYTLPVSITKNSAFFWST